MIDGCGRCKTPFGHFLETCPCRCHLPETLTHIAVTARTEYTGAVVLNELEEANE